MVMRLRKTHGSAQDRWVLPASAMTESHCRRRTVRLHRLPHAIGLYGRIPDPGSRVLRSRMAMASSHPGSVRAACR